MEKVGFGLTNWIVVILYLVGMLLVGAYFTKRSSKDTDAFFKAGGKIRLGQLGSVSLRPHLARSLSCRCLSGPFSQTGHMRSDH